MSERKWGNILSLSKGMFSLDIRENSSMGSVTKHWNGTPREVVIQLCKRLMVELDDQEGLFQDRWFKGRCSMGWVEIMKKLCALPHWIISSVISFFLLPEGILNCLVYEGKESRSNQLSILFSCYLRIFFFYVLSICVQIWMVKKKKWYIHYSNVFRYIFS